MGLELIKKFDGLHAVEGKHRFIPHARQIIGHLVAGFPVTIREKDQIFFTIIHEKKMISLKINGRLSGQERDVTC